MRSFLKTIFHHIKALFATPEIGLYLLFGLMLSVLSLVVFWNIAEDVLEGDPIVTVDTALANALHAQATPRGTALYLFVTWFGSQGVVVLGLLIGLYFVWRRQGLNLIFWTIALTGGSLLNMLLKQLVARPRPVFVNPIALEQSFSFPSGHSMNAVIAYGMLAYFIWVSFSNRFVRIMGVFAMVLVIVLIGISRMTLGVHYLSDVIGGFAAGGIWLGVCIFSLNLYKHRQLRRGAAADDTH